MSTTLTGEAARGRRTLSAQSLGWSSFLNVVGVAAWIIPCSGALSKGAHPCLAALRALGWSGGRAPVRQTPARSGRCAVQVDSGPVEVLQLFVLARCARADAATHRAGLCAHGGAGPSSPAKSAARRMSLSAQSRDFIAAMLKPSGTVPVDVPPDRKSVV